MEKAEWYEIHVYFTNNRVQILKKEDFEEHGAKGLELDAIQAVRDLAKSVDSHLEEAA